jgi:hypothetical protein
VGVKGAASPATDPALFDAEPRIFSNLSHTAPRVAGSDACPHGGAVTDWGLGQQTMKARQLIGGAAYPPDALKVIFTAFDDAWTEVAPTVSGRATAIEAARLSLAEIVLGLAKAGPVERDALKDAAVSAFRLKHGSN